jgi:hypothetical protein
VAKTLVIIENSTIAGMLADPHMVSEFPCLANAQKQMTSTKSGCGRCGRKNRTQTAQYSRVKQCLAGMGSAGKRKLKTLLDAHKIRIVYPNGAGRMVKLTF